MITIYGRANSSNVRKVLWLLAEIGLDYERLDYGRGYTPCDTPEYLAMNPNAVVPTLKDGDFVLWESNAIMRYVAARYGKESLYPRDLQQRGIVEQWLDWQLTTGYIGLRNLFMGLAVKAPDFAKPEVLEKALGQASGAMRILDAQLARTGAYVAGPELTIADTSLGMFTHRWFGLDIKRPELKALSAYYARLQKRRPFKDVIVANGI
ncbi:MAG: glutathione S-transferase family protein [Pseudomonadota bacterium]|nr:glutathione S-transferase family protein [Pseudomonadota bacterium]